MKKTLNKLQMKTVNYEITESDSPYFINVRCLKCNNIERVPFNVVGYQCKCEKCFVDQKRSKKGN